MTVQILFYSRRAQWGWLSNFHRAPQTVDGETYPTNEHYYQSQKATEPEVRRWIAEAPKPYLAMKIGRLLRMDRGEISKFWDAYRVDVMLKGLRAKFTQNPDLKEKLLGTGDAELHEDSPTDKFWGRKGADMLGKLLMQVRQELREGKI